jgi:sugar O-acyltransferase (sialic acid O-acetyltransferase NeuD family)
MAADTWIILGAGGHGRVVADVLSRAGQKVVAWSDTDPAKARASGRIPAGARVYDEREVLELCAAGRLPEGVSAAALGVGDNAARGRLLLQLGGVSLPPVIDPSAVVSATVRIGRGTVVFPNASVTTDVIIGAGVIINTSAVVEHDSELGDLVHVAPGAVLCGSVRVGTMSLIGAGSVVLPNVSVGARVTVAAGSVASGSIPDDTVAAGVPARLLRQRS